ncbi:hypothetical protein HDU81_000020 [Chytriomyces hyalinus]|nr:hypothetical protein HDU81_000020 [Chytriomyces hyalinus]
MRDRPIRRQTITPVRVAQRMRNIQSRQCTEPEEIDDDESSMSEVSGSETSKSEESGEDDDESCASDASDTDNEEPVSGAASPTEIIQEEQEEGIESECDASESESANDENGKEAESDAESDAESEASAAVSRSEEEPDGSYESIQAIPSPPEPEPKSMWGSTIGSIGLFSSANKFKAAEVMHHSHSQEIMSRSSSSSFVSAAEYELAPTAIRPRTSSRQNQQPYDPRTVQPSNNNNSAELEELKSRLEESQTIVKLLTTQQCENQFRISQLEESNAEFQSSALQKANALEDALQTEKKDYQLLKAEKMNAEEMAQQCSTELQTLKNELEAAVSERDSVKSNAESLQILMGEVLKNYKALETENEEQAKLIITLQATAAEHVNLKEEFQSVKDSSAQQELLLHATSAKLEASEETLTAYKGEIDNLNQEVASLKESYSQSEEKCQYLQCQLTESDSRRELADESVAALEITLKALKAEIILKDGKIKELEAEDLAKSEALKNAETELETERAAVQEAQLAAQEAQATTQEAQQAAQVAAQEAQLAAHDAQLTIQDLTTENEATSMRLMETTLALDGTRQLLETVIIERDELKEDLEAVQKEAASKTQENEARMQEFEDMKAVLDTKSKEIESLQNQYDSLKSELGLNAAKLYQLQETANPEACKLKSLLATKETELAEAHARIDTLETEKKSVTSELLTAQELVAELKAKVQKNRLQKSARVSEMWTELQTSRKDFESSRDQVAKMRKENAEMKGELERLQQIPITSDQIEAARTEVQARLNECTEAHNAEKEKWSEYKGQLVSIHEELEMEVSSLRTEIIQLKSSLGQSKKESQDLRQELKEKDAIILSFKSESSPKIVNSARSSVATNRTLVESCDSQTSFSKDTQSTSGLPAMSSNKGSLMGEVFSALMDKSAEAQSAAWMEEWVSKGSPPISQNTLLEIAESLGIMSESQGFGDTIGLKCGIIQGIKQMKTRMNQLEQLCQELEAFSQDTLEAAKLMDCKYSQVQSDIIQKDKVIERLHDVLEKGASTMGKRRLSSIMAVARVVVGNNNIGKRNEHHGEK